MNIRVPLPWLAIISCSNAGRQATAFGGFGKGDPSERKVVRLSPWTQVPEVYMYAIFGTPCGRTEGAAATIASKSFLPTTEMSPPVQSRTASAS